MIALLDANLFVPTWIIDPLLSLAEAGLCEPAWSARVMDEARLAIMEVRHVPDVRARGFLDATLQGLSDGHGGGLGAV